MTYEPRSRGAIMRYGMGAAVTQTPIFDYEAVATQLASAALASGAMPSVTVELGLNGANPIVKTYPDAGSAADAFEVVVNTPSSSRAYAGLFDKTGVIASQYFGVTQSIETTTTLNKLKDLAPYLVGGALLIAAAVWFRDKKRGKAPRKRRRRASTWRRRVTTTWR